MSEDNIVLEILIEYSIKDFREFALSRGIDIEHKTRGALILELLKLED